MLLLQGPRSLIILVILQVFLSSLSKNRSPSHTVNNLMFVIADAQEEVEFPEDGVGEEYDAEYIDVNDLDYDDGSQDYEIKNYDYVLEKDPVTEVMEVEDDIIEDLDAVAMDEGITLSLSDVEITTTTTTTPPPPPPQRPTVFISLIIGELQLKQCNNYMLKQ